MEQNTNTPSKNRITARKREMSQVFGENAKVIPVTLLACDETHTELLHSLEPHTHITVIGYSKGKGFAGTMKKWGFHGEPATHGYDKHRGAGSIGGQGVGRVTKFQKMAGRLGGEKKTVQSKIVAFDTAARVLTITGCVPGMKNSKVTVILPEKTV